MKFKTIIISVLVCMLLGALAFARDARQIRVYIDDKTNLKNLNQSSLDVVSEGDDYIEIITTQEEHEKISSLGFRTEIIHQDLVAHYQSRLLQKDMGGYKTLDEINAAVDTLIMDHPSLVSNKIVLGQSLEGRDIYAVVISDNPNILEDEPEVLYHSAIHCREVITPEVLLYFMNYLTDNYGIDPEVDLIVENRQLWFVLNVNPDGYVYNEIIEPNGGGLWRKNRRNNGDGSFGVDVNRNYGYGWGFDDNGSSPDPSSNTYRGTGPFSEPESQVMRDFIESRNFVITVDYHSYSDLILWPWGYDYLYTEDEALFAMMGDSIAAYNGYAPGPIWTLYLVNGGTVDWGYGETTTKNKNLAISLEVGGSSDGFWPNPLDIPELVSENLGPNMYIARVAGDIYQQVPPVQPELFVSSVVDSVSYDVTWQLEDTLNPALVFELVELQGKTSGTDPADNFDSWVEQGFSLSGSDFLTAPSAFYSNNGNNLYTRLTTKDPYFVLANDSIYFQTKYAIEEDWDYAYVQVSTDGINFTSLPGNITTISNPNGNNTGNGITGFSSGSWVPAVFDLSAYAGQEIYIRLVYQTDQFVVEDGFRVDEFYPVVTFASSTIIGSALTDTFYTFTEKPTGTYYYKVRGEDAENQWSDFSDVKQTVVVSNETDCFVVGDINGDGLTLSVADLVDMVRFFGDSIPQPDTLYKMDFTGDCIVNPDDIALFNDYFTFGLSVFPQYPIPTCCVVELDRDGDNILDPDETAIGTNAIDEDSDGDSVPDDVEVGNILSPLDTDNDGLIDALDPDDDDDGILTIDEVGNGDTDSDNLPDYLDQDDDDDGILTNVDNCPLVYNPSQANINLDNVGDACDPCCTNIRGNTDNDQIDEINIADIVFLVAYSFSGGPAPACEVEVDVNGSATIDIADIVYLVDYSFNGGPPPAPCNVDL